MKQKDISRTTFLQGKLVYIHQYYRNNYNSFLESRLNLGAYQGGTKG